MFFYTTEEIVGFTIICVLRRGSERLSWMSLWLSRWWSWVCILTGTHPTTNRQQASNPNLANLFGSGGSWYWRSHVLQITTGTLKKHLYLYHKEQPNFWQGMGKNPFSVILPRYAVSHSKNLAKSMKQISAVATPNRDKAERRRL